MNTGTIDSPFGPISFTVKGGFVTRVKFEPGKDNFDGGDPLMVETARQLREYAAAARFSFDLPLTPAFSLLLCPALHVGRAAHALSPGRRSEARTT